MVIRGLKLLCRSSSFGFCSDVERQERWNILSENKMSVVCCFCGKRHILLPSIIPSRPGHFVFSWLLAHTWLILLLSFIFHMTCLHSALLLLFLPEVVFSLLSLVDGLLVFVWTWAINQALCPCASASASRGRGLVGVLVFLRGGWIWEGRGGGADALWSGRCALMRKRFTRVNQSEQSQEEPWVVTRAH